MVVGVLTNNAYVMDNAGTGTTVVGTWATVYNSSSDPTTYLYNYRTHDAGTGTNSFTWTPTLSSAGSYRVYARWVAGTDRANNATFEVTSSSGTTPVAVNQQQNDGEWVLLGTFNRTPGQGHKVRLTDNANGLVVADAVKFIPADESTVYAVQTDHLNIPRLVVDRNQVAVWRWDQADPFGNNVPNQDPDGNSITFEFPLRFPGQYFDKETNTHYNYYRDYDPAIGRYIQSDPIGLAGGINTYAYVDNNPLSKTDPTGEFAVVGGLIGGFGNLAYQLYQNNGNLNCVNWWQVGAWALTGSGVGIIGRAGLSGIGNFFYNPNSFRSISSSYWAARGGAGGMSLDHWAISQAAVRSEAVSPGVANAGWNLLQMPSSWNTWLGFAPNWGGTQAAFATAARTGIQVGVPGIGATSGYAGYQIGTNAQNNCGCP